MWLCIFFVLIPSVLCANKACGKSSFTCPDSATCCQLADKSYGCCPLKNAVCCNDHIHCCPAGTKCETGICIQLQGTNVTTERLDNDVIFNSEFLCGENKTYCNDLIPGTYRCCLLPDGICCDDFQHCCPQNTVCDSQKEMCVGKGFVSEMYDSKKNGLFKFGTSKHLKLSLLKSSNFNSIFCPGGYKCPNGYTCCQLPTGAYGCCPFIKATCCADKLHCCPHDMKCDTNSTLCLRENISIPSLQKEIAKPFNTNIVCPDNSTCAADATCCMIRSVPPEQFGCCPYEDAVCCEDLTHCCPKDYFCDLVEKRCKPASKSSLSKVIKNSKVN